MAVMEFPLRCKWKLQFLRLTVIITLKCEKNYVLCTKQHRNIYFVQHLKMSFVSKEQEMNYLAY